MNEIEALAWVHSLPRLAKKPGVENTKKLLEILGNPQKNLQFVHVAGTNGKGSTVVMLANILQKAGYKTGMTISPFVLDFRERFQINGQMIEPQILAALLTEIKSAAEKLSQSGWDGLVEFAAVTAAALLWFSREKCEIVCMETGLGGRLDATNAVQNTRVACITAIGKDHTELLGDTYAKIAAEKCGIFKNNCIVISYPAQRQEAMDEIAVCAQTANCELRVPDIADLHYYKGQPFENRINYGGYDLNVPFAGQHQAYNAAVAVEAALALCEGDNSYDISDDAIIEGIAAARFPARIEILSREPYVILDGMHNVDGAKALAATLSAAKLNHLTAIIGVLEDKNPEEILSTLAPYFDMVYTVTPDSPRALGATELANMGKKHFAHISACDSVKVAIRQAKGNMANGLVVCGSLYLAAQARELLL